MSYGKEQTGYGNLAGMAGQQSREMPKPPHDASNDGLLYLASSILDTTENLADMLATIESRVFLPMPESSDNLNQPNAENLHGMLRETHRRMQSLLAHAQSINERL